MTNPIPLTIHGNGQPLVWLHGMLNSVEADSLFSMVDLHKAAEKAKVIRYDACGKSVTGNYQWDAMTRQLAEIVEANNLEPLIIGGTSMGSVTALHYAVNYPEKVKALILSTPPPAWESRAAVKAVYRKISAKANHGIIPDFLKRLIAQTQDPPDFYEQQHPGTRQQLMEYRLGFDPSYYAQIYLGGAASDLPPRDQIASLKIPTFIVALPEDENHPLAIARELKELIPNSCMEVVCDYQQYLNLQCKIGEFISSL